MLKALQPSRRRLVAQALHHHLGDPRQRMTAKGGHGLLGGEGQPQCRQGASQLDGGDRLAVDQHPVAVEDDQGRARPRDDAQGR